MSSGNWLDGQGQAITYPQVIAQAAAAQVVLLGERHDRADHHRWQLHVAAALAARRTLVMGFEMFPARANAVLAEWVSGRLSEVDFLARSEWSKTWGFPAELYMPLFRFCREMRIPMIGLNVPRDLVRAVGISGWDDAPEVLKDGLTRPAASSAAYREFIFALTGGPRPGRKAQSAADPDFDNFVAAQEVWDRAFATQLVGAVAAGDAPLAIGIMGMGHVQYGGGVPWQLRDLGLTDCCVMIPKDQSEAFDAAAADMTFLLPEVEVADGVSM